MGLQSSSVKQLYLSVGTKEFLILVGFLNEILKSSGIREKEERWEGEREINICWSKTLE